VDSATQRKRDPRTNSILMQVHLGCGFTQALTAAYGKTKEALGKLNSNTVTKLTNCLGIFLR
jgi:hypothetical protein